MQEGREGGGWANGREPFQGDPRSSRPPPPRDPSLFLWRAANCEQESKQNHRTRNRRQKWWWQRTWARGGGAEECRPRESSTHFPEELQLLPTHSAAPSTLCRTLPGRGCTSDPYESPQASCGRRRGGHCSAPGHLLLPSPHPQTALPPALHNGARMSRLHPFYSGGDGQRRPGEGRQPEPSSLMQCACVEQPNPPQKVVNRGRGERPRGQGSAPIGRPFLKNLSRSSRASPPPL